MCFTVLYICYFRKKRSCMASSGQTSIHSRQTIHISSCSLPGSESRILMPIGQIFSQSPHLVHRIPCREIPSRLCLPKRPIIAPVGQIHLHHALGMKIVIPTDPIRIRRRTHIRGLHNDNSFRSVGSKP